MPQRSLMRSPWEDFNPSAVNQESGGPPVDQSLLALQGVENEVRTPIQTNGQMTNSADDTSWAARLPSAFEKGSRSISSALPEGHRLLAPTRKPDLLDELIAAMEEPPLTEFERYFDCSNTRKTPTQVGAILPQVLQGYEHDETGLKPEQPFGPASPMEGGQPALQQGDNDAETLLRPAHDFDLPAEPVVAVPTIAQRRNNPSRLRQIWIPVSLGVGSLALVLGILVVALHWNERGSKKPVPKPRGPVSLAPTDFHPAPASESSLSEESPPTPPEIPYSVEPRSGHGANVAPRGTRASHQPAAVEVGLPSPLVGLAPPETKNDPIPVPAENKASRLGSIAGEVRDQTGTGLIVTMHILRSADGMHIADVATGPQGEFHMLLAPDSYDLVAGPSLALRSCRIRGAMVRDGAETWAAMSLDASFRFPAHHLHRFGSCAGLLIVTRNEVIYRATSPNFPHSFTFKRDALESKHSGQRTVVEFRLPEGKARFAIGIPQNAPSSSTPYNEARSAALCERAIQNFDEALRFIEQHAVKVPESALEPTGSQ